MAKFENIDYGQVLYKVSYGLPRGTYSVTELRVVERYDDGSIDCECRYSEDGELVVNNYKKSRLKDLRTRKPKGINYGGFEHKLYKYLSVDG